jgi:hypothetical protein
MVWREAPALADPFIGALKSGRPPTATLRLPAGAKRLKAAGVCDFSGGRAGEGGLEKSRGLFSQVPNLPSRTSGQPCQLRLGGLEERLHRKGRRLGNSRLDSEATFGYPRRFP